MTLTDPATDVSPVEPPGSSSRGRRRSIAVLVVLAVVILALLSQGLLHNLNYFDTVNQAMAQRTTLGTSDFRLEGVVTPGTIERTSSGATFYLNGRHSREVYVIARGEPPQLFRADIPVVVDGHFTTRSSRTFVATSIIVKHTASYVAQHPGRVRAPNGSVR